MLIDFPGCMGLWTTTSWRLATLGSVNFYSPNSTGMHDVDRFSKMHGLGNDFMVVDGVTQKVFFSNDVIKKLADRHFGIGFDQLLLVEPPYDPELDFHYRIFNADGSEVEQCGNGARCFARFVRLKGLINRDRIAVSTARGRIMLLLEGENQVTVNMGVPQFEPARSRSGPRRRKKPICCGRRSIP